jgi:DNA gyrase/topoisomerase IV subunit A
MKIALDVVNHCYREYARYVNSYRALPDSRDGLKSVQRRILLTCSDINKKAKSAQVVGMTIAQYHPHGDSSIYGALVNLVTSTSPLLIGQGNFGSRGLVPSPPAAMRYTGVELSTLGKLFLEYKEYSHSILNDLSYNEQLYLPTPIPYSLISGVKGIGVGVRTYSPSCSLKSIKTYLKSGDKKNLISPSLSEGNLEITNEELILFNKKGLTAFKVYADVKWEYSNDEDRNVLVVTNIPWIISPSVIFNALRTEIAEGLIYIRDESTDKIRLVIARHPRVRRISDDELLKKVKNAFTSKQSFVNFVSHEGVAKILTPHEMIDNALKYCEKAYRNNIDKLVSKVCLEIKFNQVKSQLAKHLINNTEEKRIKEELSLTNQEYESFTQRSIKSLLSKPKDVIDLQSQKDNLNNLLQNIRSSIYKNHISLFGK